MRMATLSDRAKERLKLLAGLLRGKGQKFTMPRDQFYDEVQAVVKALPQLRQLELKELVDWLEDYQAVERSSQPESSSNSGRRAPKAKSIPPKP